MKRTMSSLFLVIVIAILVFNFPTSTGIAGVGTRPVVRGQNGVVACGHFLAAELGIHIMRQGGMQSTLE